VLKLFLWLFFYALNFNSLNLFFYAINSSKSESFIGQKNKSLKALKVRESCNIASRVLGKFEICLPKKPASCLGSRDASFTAHLNSGHHVRNDLL
jgi:hypothetical protein